MFARHADTGSNDIQIVAMDIHEQMIVPGTNAGTVDSFKVLRAPEMHLRRQAKPGILCHVILQTQIEFRADLVV